jgi:hypothetical protein
LGRATEFRSQGQPYTDGGNSISIHRTAAVGHLNCLLFLLATQTSEENMAVQYMVKAFLPTVSGCGGKDNGWDEIRCNQFQEFLNSHAVGGWRLHSSEFRSVAVKGCGGNKGSWLVCTFEKSE